MTQTASRKLIYLGALPLHDGFMDYAPVSRPKDIGVGARLRKDMEKKGVSARALGKKLAIRAGKDNPDGHEEFRKYVVRWLRLTDGHGLGPANADLVAAELETEAERYASKKVYLDAEELKRREYARLQAQMKRIREGL